MLIILIYDKFGAFINCELIFESQNQSLQNYYYVQQLKTPASCLYQNRIQVKGSTLDLH